MKPLVPRPTIGLHVHAPGVRIEGEFERWSAVLVHRQDDSNLVTVGLLVDSSLPELDRAERSRLFLFSSSHIERVADTAVLATGLFSAEQDDPQVIRVALDVGRAAPGTLALSFALPLAEHSRRWWQALVDGNVLAALQLFPPEGGLN